MCVGGMGHAISIATGINASSNKKKIICFLMEMAQLQCILVH